MHVPDFVIERPHHITPLLISLERNMERRRCMIERFGVERFIREVDAKLVSKDRSGRLWRVDFKGVTSNNAQQLWKGRKKLFLKPAGGHGSKAVYRGDKLTKRVWAEIIRGGYIAQEFAAPSERMVKLDGSPQVRKTDVRLYVYDGKVLLTAARLYQGQTTNFRTPGGGFTPVFVI